jgi:hypothetical protein
MKFAFVDNIRTEASSKALGICPLCNAAMRGYAGPLRIKHWKHISKLDCDGWFEPETAWHREWKNKFPVEWQETIIDKNSTKHIADVYNPNKDLVIEFQNSSISIEELDRRELFYDKMIWVVNTIPFKKDIRLDKTWHYLFNEKIFKPIERKANSFNKPFYNIFNIFMKIYIHRQEEISRFASGELNQFLEQVEIDKRQQYYNLIWSTLDPLEPYDIMRAKVHDLVEDLFFKDTEYLESIRLYKEVGELNDRLVKKFESYNFFDEHIHKDFFFFSWKRQHKHWNFAKKPIFLDIGDENIYLVNENWKYGSGFIVKRYPKTEFLRHYS